MLCSFFYFLIHCITRTFEQGKETIKIKFCYLVTAPCDTRYHYANCYSATAPCDTR